MDVAKNFYNKMQKMFDELLYEEIQKFFIFKGKNINAVDLDYSKVFFNSSFEIYKKNKEDSFVSKVESKEFGVVDVNGVCPKTFCLFKNGQEINLTPNQKQKMLIDCFGKLYKIDLNTKKVIPADFNSGFYIKYE